MNLPLKIYSGAEFPPPSSFSSQLTQVLWFYIKSFNSDKTGPCLQLVSPAFPKINLNKVLLLGRECPRLSVLGIQVPSCVHRLHLRNFSPHKFLKTAAPEPHGNAWRGVRVTQHWIIGELKHQKSHFIINKAVDL